MAAYSGSLDRLNQIEIPVLLTGGTEEVLTPPEFLRTMAGEIDGALHVPES